jgi:hypothetical protein
MQPTRPNDAPALAQQGPTAGILFNRGSSYGMSTNPL